MNLHLCPLFQGLSPSEVDTLLEGRTANIRYRAGEMVAMQGSRYDALMIVAEGKVRGEMTDELGRTTLIEEIPAPRVVAPAFLYATQNLLPVTILADVPTTICVISQSNFTRMMQQEDRLLTNFLRSMSDRSRFLSDKLRMQRFGTIRSKLARYLLEQSAGQSVFTIPHTQQQLADRFGVTRPALSRGIAHLEEEGFIRSDRKQFEILNRKALLET